MSELAIASTVLLTAFRNSLENTNERDWAFESFFRDFKISIDLLAASTRSCFLVSEETILYPYQKFAHPDFLHSGSGT